MLALFAGQNYYAQGGLHDFICCGESCECLIYVLKRLNDIAYDWYDMIEWWHIVDLDTMKIITGSEYQSYNAPKLKNYYKDE